MGIFNNGGPGPIKDAPPPDPMDHRLWSRAMLDAQMAITTPNQQLAGMGQGSVALGMAYPHPMSGMINEVALAKHNNEQLASAVHAYIEAALKIDLNNSPFVLQIYFDHGQHAFVMGIQFMNGTVLKQNADKVRDLIDKSRDEVFLTQCRMLCDLAIPK